MNESMYQDYCPEVSREEIESGQYYSSVMEEGKNLIATMHIKGIVRTMNLDVYEYVLSQEGFCDMVKYVGIPEEWPEIIKWAQHIPSRKFITLSKPSV